jgi:hypothetical protein
MWRQSRLFKEIRQDFRGIGRAADPGRNAKAARPWGLRGLSVGSAAEAAARDHEVVKAVEIV